MQEGESLISAVKDCRICEPFLPLGPRPVISISKESKILIIGQAPGTRVHKTGIPWNDPSGDELRRWLDVDRDQFYDPKTFGIMPMGFCYPGRGKGGDLPPRPECAPHWHAKLMNIMPNVKLTLLIGDFAQRYYLGKSRMQNLTETVRSFEDYLPDYFPLVLPSPRNRLWMRKNDWFESDVIPRLRERLNSLIIF
ncbi:uracil-DNA glycosylase family protein [Algoriphagus hitonicola]|uniref:Uracil-DNA glycosylase n=1 Tax=Algoriphagus hitonicola TaxID=435880 RepID=A0A1I2TVY7_9BACT|nr:uracil-DNA glycosylase family protein [Algoriphagus hitonicola]SFG68923.1 Uracil-DNA glycosylase [Algoriphagus hitonicola]